MPKTRRTVQDSFRTASVSPAQALAAAERVRGDREAAPPSLSKSALNALYKSAPVLVKGAADRAWPEG